MENTVPMIILNLLNDLVKLSFLLFITSTCIIIFISVVSNGNMSRIKNGLVTNTILYYTIKSTLFLLITCMIILLWVAIPR
jgi:hypothetical protein